IRTGLTASSVAPFTDSSGRRVGCPRERPLRCRDPPPRLYARTTSTAQPGVGSPRRQTKEAEMRRAILPLALVLAIGVGFAVVKGTGKDKPKGVQHGATIHVIEHATTDSVDVDAVGHVLTFANDVFDSSDAAKVGSDQGYCVRVVAHTSWECNWTTFVASG